MHEFSYDATTNDWRLTKIRDAFRNYLRVDYSDDSLTWTFVEGNDGHGDRRSHVALFRTTGFSGNYGKVLDRLTLAGPSPSYKYLFWYQNSFEVTRSCNHTDSPGAPSKPDDPPALGPTDSVPVLLAITLPDGSTIASTYDTSTDCLRSGLLTSIQLPTRGRIAWAYDLYPLPSLSYTKAGAPMTGTNAGVTQRSLTNAAGTLAGTWTYTPDNSIREQFTNTIQTPEGDKTVNYFSVYDATYLAPAGQGWTRNQYGLPYTRVPSTIDRGRFLSAEVFDCDAGGTNCASKRRSYVLYDIEPNTGGPNNLNLNRRQRESHTIFVDDNSRFAESVLSSFDGFGHYETETLGGDFSSGNSRTITTNYLGNVHPSNGWMINTYDSIVTTEAGLTARREYTFNPGTGALEIERTLVGSAASTPDLRYERKRDTRGNVTHEKWLGGDSGNNEYQIRHDYTVDSGGMRKRSYYTTTTDDIAASTGVDLSDQYFDRYFDVVTSSTDSAGLTTTFVYDGATGRLAQSKPAIGQGAYTLYTYTVPTSSTPAKVAVNQYANGGFTTLLTEREIEFDSFGRVFAERRRVHDGSTSGAWVSSTTDYNAMGWKTSVTQPQTSTQSATTYFQNYDPFGRVGRIRPPDSSDANPVHDVTFAYTGTRLVAKTSTAGTSRNGSTINETSATRTEEYDRQGRLHAVTEPSNAGGGYATTTYGYDAGGRLSNLNQGAQTRTFSYDNRGFLLSETHPEKTPAVNYSLYDARGHAGRRLEGDPNGLFDTRYTFDSSERLTSVSDNGGTRTVKSLTYASANGTLPGGGTDYKKGKLEEVIGYNPHPTSGTVTVKEHSFYGGIDGRVSRRDTDVTIPSGGTQTFTQTWDYNSLGNAESIGYPQCTHTGCTSASRTITQGYQHGFLKSAGITGGTTYASSLTYHPNGRLNQIAHGNNVIDTENADPAGSGRPKSLTFNGWVDTAGCTAAGISTQPADATIAPGSPSSLSVTAGGSAPISYQWYRSDPAGAAWVALGTSASLQDTPTQTAYYQVRVTNNCGSLDSRVATVTVSTCANPSITQQPSSTTITTGSSATLSVTATNGTPTYQWYVGASGNTTAPISGATGASLISSPTASTTYWVRVTNSCGSTDSIAATIWVAPPAPAGLMATATTTTTVTITWSAVSGAASYEVWRSSNNSAYAPVGFPATNAYSDTVTAGVTYLYKVKSRSGDGVVSQTFSNLDLATTILFTDDPLCGQSDNPQCPGGSTLIRATHFTELRTAVNAVRAAAGLGAVDWTSNPSPPVTGGLMDARHITDLRTWLDAARALLGFSTGGYGETITQGVTLVRKSHLTELRERVK